MSDENQHIELSRRKALAAIGTIGGASAGAALGTNAYLSDEETFEQNQIAAGSIDLKVDWEEHYSDWSEDETENLSHDVLMEPPQEGQENYIGLPDPQNPMVFVHQDDLGQFMDNTSIEAFPDADGDGIQDSLEEYDACEDFADTPEDLNPAESLRTRNSDTWQEGAPKPLVSLDDVKPGDFGELTLSFHLCDNPGYVWLQGGLGAASENGVTDPESQASDEQPGSVELFDQIQTLVWYDDDLDNVFDKGEEVIFRGSLRRLLKLLSRKKGIPLDGDRSTAFNELRDPDSADSRECFENSTTSALGIAWWVPINASNAIQTDAVSFDLGFYAEQCRHRRGGAEKQFSRTTQDNVSKLSHDNVREPPEDLEDRTVREEYPVSEQEFEEWKERASTGELPQPPEDNIQDELGGGGGQAPGNSAIAQQQSISTGEGFKGWNSSDLRARPSDANIAVGPEHAVLAVNLRWGIYDKSGNRGFQALLEDWWAPIIDEENTFVFDPKTLYDHHSGRFVMVAVGRNSSEDEAMWLVAVSDDSDPFGTWWLTKIPHGDGWVDYPGLGVDQNGIYLTANIFNGGFQYSRLVIIDKTPLYNGNSFTYWWYNDLRNSDGSRAFTVQPTQAVSASQNQYLVNSQWNTGNTLTLWELQNPTSNPQLSRHDISVNNYSLPPDAEQPGSSGTVDTVDARLMNAVYSNGSVWTAHSISYDWNNDGDASALLKWYEIDANNKSLAQSRGWGRPNGDYYFPTISTIPDRSAMIVYNESGPDVNPRIEVAGRTQGHTQNSLEDVAIVKDGESAYNPTTGTDRWGDYNGIVVDFYQEEIPKYWTHSQYAADAGNTDEFETWAESVFF